MTDSELIAEVLKSIYDKAINELEFHAAGHLNDGESALATTFINIIKDTHNEYCSPENRL